MTPDLETGSAQKCATLATLLDYIAEDCDSPAAFLQLFYLSREAEIMEAALIFASLPEDMKGLALKMLSTLAREAEMPEWAPAKQPLSVAGTEPSPRASAAPPCHSTLTW
ncbi:MAG: hypothetical protein K2X57_04585 [Xanthobacteraceae bacterium]|nr:hypothetical protein [Xanthobacteraceae bacterium]MBY0611663.1 hypothetical protein [Beijerinckiaceae bacterium]